MTSPEHRRPTADTTTKTRTAQRPRTAATSAAASRDARPAMAHNHRPACNDLHTGLSASFSNRAASARRITDSACKNQLVVVSVQYGPFNPYIPIRSTTIGKSRVAKDPIAMHTSWRSNSDIASVTRVSMTFRVVRTNQYNQDLGLIHSTNGNHLESPNEGSSIDHQEQDLEANSKATCNFESYEHEQQLRAFAPANNSLYKRYRVKELFERSPTLPQLSKTTAGIDGNLPEKLTVNSDQGLKNRERKSGNIL
ncbi:Tau class glutathione S-transferase [Dorcoceras hygrometricum]|nr:Tau class glutathione S-transferase [Dorcoceras hygrometricum]